MVSGKLSWERDRALRDDSAAICKRKTDRKKNREKGKEYCRCLITGVNSLILYSHPLRSLSEISSVLIALTNGTAALWWPPSNTDVMQCPIPPHADSCCFVVLTRVNVYFGLFIHPDSTVLKRGCQLCLHTRCSDMLLSRKTVSSVPMWEIWSCDVRPYQCVREPINICCVQNKTLKPQLIHWLLVIDFLIIIYSNKGRYKYW